MKIVKITCDQCGEEKEIMLRDLESQSDSSDTLRLYVGKTKNQPDRIGYTTNDLCLNCGIKAEIELREFIKKSKFFTEEDPF